MARYPTSEGARLQNEYGGSVTHTGLQFEGQRLEKKMTEDEKSC